MVCKKGYDRSVDFWALGVLAYELICKEPPFTSAEINSTKFQKRCRKWEEKPTFYRQTSGKAYEFIKGLLKVDPQERLGYNDFAEIKEHAFFEDIDWK